MEVLLTFRHNDIIIVIVVVTVSHIVLNQKVLVTGKGRNVTA